MKSIRARLSNVSFPKIRFLGNKRSDEVDNPLRFTTRPAEDMRLSTAQKILGIVYNPKAKQFIDEGGELKEVAVFSSLDSQIRRLTMEFDLLRQKYDSILDEDKREKIWLEMESLLARMSGEMRAVVHHEQPPMPNLSLALKYMRRGTFLLRSVLRSHESFMARMDEVASWGDPVLYAGYLARLKRHVTGINPKFVDMDLEGQHIRDLNYWSSPAHMLLPDEDDVTGSLRGKLITSKEAGLFMHQILVRDPFEVISRSGDGGKPRFREHPGNALKVACSSLPYFEDDHYIINQRAYRIYSWPIQFDKDVLDKLIDNRDVDFLLCVDLVPRPEDTDTRDVWVTALLRASSEVINGRFPKLDAISRQLRRFNATPLRGQDMRHAFQAFVTGADIVDISVRLGLHQRIRTAEQRETLFNALGSKVNSGQATTQGNFFWGFQGYVDDQGKDVPNKNMPVFGDAESDGVVIFVAGVQSAGKTLSATALYALQRTPNVVVIHYSTARGETWPILARKMNGKVYTIDLPDVSSEEFPDEEERHKQQRKLNTAAVEKAKEFAESWENDCREAGAPVGLPIVIKPKVNSTAYIAFASNVQEQLSLAYERVFVTETEGEAEVDTDSVQEEIGLADEMVFTPAITKSEDELGVELAVDDSKLLIMFAEDINNLDIDTEWDSVLGPIPRQVNAEAREKLHDACYNYRKRRQAFIATLQSVNNLFEFRWPVDAIHTLVHIEQAPKAKAKVATIYTPAKAKSVKEMTVRHEKIHVTIPTWMLNYVLRPEDLHLLEN